MDVKLTLLAGNDSQILNDPKYGILEACKEHADDSDFQEKLKDLLSKGGELDIPDSTDKKGRCALHYVAKYGSYHKLISLVNSGADINKLDRKGRTALHYAAKTPCAKEDSDRYASCVYILMQMDYLNRPDTKGYTALTYAAIRQYKERISAMMLHQKWIYLNLDISTAYDGTKARELIIDLFPEMLEELHGHPALDNHLPTVQSKLLDAFRNFDLKEFSGIVKEGVDVNYIYEEPYYSTIIEIVCSSIPDSTAFVVALLAAGSDPNTVNFIYKKPLQHVAVENGNQEILKSLLVFPLPVDQYKRNVIHYAAKLQAKNCNQTNNIHNCVDMLLRRYALWNRSHSVDRFDINAADIDGNTVLHLAAAAGDDQMVLSLLKYGASLQIENNEKKTPLTSLSPEVLKNFLDDQIGCSRKSCTDPDFSLLFNYGILLNDVDKKSSGTKTLVLLSTSLQHRYLLTHPVLSSFLDIKWNLYKRYFYFNIFFYFIFVVLLTTHILLLSQLAVRESGILNHILLLIVIPLSVRELVQLYFKKLKYFTNLDNFVELPLFILTLVILYSDGLGGTTRRVVLAITVLLAWTELLLITGRLPVMSVQLKMLKTTFFTFVRYMSWYSILILAFALSFHILFRDTSASEDNVFLSPWWSLLKTTIMMTGEFEMSVSLMNTVPVAGHVIFFVFVLLVAVVVLNLLNGLAVKDTGNISDEADLIRHTAQVKIMSFIERSYLHIKSQVSSVTDAFNKFFPSNDLKEYVLQYPNKDKFDKNVGLLKKCLLFLKNIYLESTPRFESNTINLAMEIVQERRRNTGFLKSKDKFQNKDEIILSFLREQNERINQIEENLRKLIEIPDEESNKHSE